MAVLLFLLLIFTPCLYPQQLVRSRWEYGGGISLLYRLEDDEALAEISLSRSTEGDMSADRAVFETRNFSFGSFSPSGLWRFTAMETLLSSSELRPLTGVKPDRSSARSLDRPLFAYHRDGAGPGRASGGLFVQSSQEWLYSGVWGIFDLGEYRKLQAGSSVFYPDPVPENRDDEPWFCGADETRINPVYHLVSEFRQEMAWSRFSLSAALSGAQDSQWGASLLPALDLYGRFADWSIRYWYNSPFWINSRGEVTVLRESLENRFRFYITDGLRMDLQWEISVADDPECPPFNEFNLAVVYEKNGLTLESEYELLPPSVTEEYPAYSHRLNLGSGWKRGVLTLKAGWGAEADRRGIKELSASGGIRCRLGISTTGVSLDYSEVPGIVALKPSVEETLRLGCFKLQGRASVGLNWPGPGKVDPDAIVLSITGEWRSR